MGGASAQNDGILSEHSPPGGSFFYRSVPAGGTRRQGSDRSDPRLQTGVSQAINPTAPAGLGDLVVVFGTTSPTNTQSSSQRLVFGGRYMCASKY